MLQKYTFIFESGLCQPGISFSRAIVGLEPLNNLNFRDLLDQYGRSHLYTFARKKMSVLIDLDFRLELCHIFPFFFPFRCLFLRPHYGLLVFEAGYKIYIIN